MSAGHTGISIELAGALGGFEIAVDLDVSTSGITALFGPSGCGKTTILRCLAGLERLPGRIRVDGEAWQDTDARIFLPPHQRHVGYVFQEPSLFSHLSVRDNLLFGARRIANDPANSKLAFDDIVRMLAIAPLLERATHGLSGGERQRVAVGRALLAAPRVLLMDEPLSALDRQSKDDILPYFEMLHEKLAIPILYVSHDVTEIERLADVLVLLEKGRVLAAGPLRELQTDARLPLLTAPAATVVLDARVSALDQSFGLTEMQVDGGCLMVPGRHGSIGDKRRLRIAASDVSLARTAPKDSTILNSLPARILAIEGGADAPQMHVILALGTEAAGSRIAARVTRKSLSVLSLRVGDDVFAQIKSVALVATRGGGARQN